MNPYSRFVNQSEIDLDQSGLVGAWKLKPVNESVADLVGSANMFRFGSPVYEVDSFLDTIRFDGDKDYLRSPVQNYRSSDLQGTISCWFKVNTMGVSNDLTLVSSSNEVQDVFYLTAHIGRVANPYLYIVERTDGGADSVRGSTIIIPGVWYHAVIVSNGSAWILYLNGQTETLVSGGGGNTGDWFGDVPNRNNLCIGALRRSSVINKFDGQIRRVEIFSDVKDADWVTAKYKEGADTIQFKTDYGVYESVSDEDEGNVGITSPFRILSGSWKITEDTIEGVDTKVIECISDGVCYVPTSFFLGNDIENSYGDVQWWIKKVDAAILRIMFIASKKGNRSVTGQNGYEFQFNDDERLYLNRITNGAVAANLFYSAVDYGSVDTWINIKFTRQLAPDKRFTGYSDGSIISPAFGNNPIVDGTHEISRYFVLDFVTGCKFAYSDIQGNHSFIKRLGV